jgi:SAM-dependent methyltransferase
MERSQAEQYRNRFREKGKRERTHLRELNVLQQLLDKIGKVDVILDVACGPGRFAYLLKDHCTRLIQTDISQHMLDLSREDYPLNDQEGQYILADAGKIPLPDNSVDLVFCHRFLNHVPDPDQRKQIFSELTRVTRKYVVASCLGAPGFIRPIQWLYSLLRGKRMRDKSVEIPDFIQSAVDAGLILQSRTPIRPRLSTSAFFTFVKSTG